MTDHWSNMKCVCCSYWRWYEELLSPKSDQALKIGNFFSVLMGRELLRCSFQMKPATLHFHIKYFITHGLQTWCYASWKHFANKQKYAIKMAKVSLENRELVSHKDKRHFSSRGLQSPPQVAFSGKPLSCISSKGKPVQEVWIRRPISPQVMAMPSLPRVVTVWRT